MLHNLAQLPRYRALIQSLVARELKARYRGSMLGFFWSFINPLLLLMVYSIVFAYIMPARFTGGEEPRPFVDAYPYAVFLFSGLLPWTWFAASLNESAGVLISGGNLIKKVLFPAEVLPIVTSLANMVHFLFGLPILALFLGYYRAPITPGELAWFPLIVLVQLIFTMALGLLVAALTVHFRDIRDILSNVLSLWFFATPIIYPWQHAPDLGKWFLNANPFTHLAISYQEVLFFEGPFGHWRWLLVLGVMSVGFFLFAYFVFDRLRDTFAEEV
jgi:lipopolysaccharide transport system permease protein